MNASTDLRLVTLAPGHFHAALVHRSHPAGVDPRVRVFAPLDADVLTHLERVRRFNDREHEPTHWHLDVRAGHAWLDDFRNDSWGNVAIIAGRNRPKISLIQAALARGLHVLADKPCIVTAADLPALQACVAEAKERGLLFRDMMTERHEVTTQLQRQLLHDQSLVGSLLPGTVEEPTLELESVHFLAKNVAGVPLVRPTWWYDPHIAGIGPADVGTHLTDLAMWLLAPSQAFPPGSWEVLATETWPTRVPLEAFFANTQRTELPTALQPFHDGEELLYHGNGRITYRLGEHVVRWTVRWEVGPDACGDTHLARVRGTKANVLVMHDPTYGAGPQVFVEAKNGERTHVPLTVARTGHEAHFAEVLHDFLEEVRHPEQRTTHESANLLAKYAITTAFRCL